MRLIRRFPFVLILVGIWTAARFSGIELTLANPLSWALAGACTLVTALEFFKSANISTTAFEIDLCCAVLAVTCFSIAVDRLWLVSLDVPDLFVGAAVFSDALLSPANSFRSALRNVQAGVNTAPSELQ